MIKVVVLGASGSIGVQALEVIKAYPKQFKLVGASVHTNASAAAKIASAFKIDKIAITGVNNNSNYISGKNAIDTLIKTSKPSIVLNAIAGRAGVTASLTIIKNKVNLALANKETLVMAGDLILKYASANRVKIYPVDSEHNAIYQLLKGSNKLEIKNLILTASGGPFYGFSIAKLKKVKIEETLKHPTWKMGKKISVDSATMFNKGLEVIEAHHLFNTDYKNIKVMINRSSNIHSMVEFSDGSIKAHIGIVSMKIPLINAMSQTSLEFANKLDLTKPLSLELKPIIINEFPALDLAYRVGKLGKHYPLLYSVANEVAVEAYLSKKIDFLDIYKVVEASVLNFKTKLVYSLANLAAIEEEIVAVTLNQIKKRGK
jgi:1-deoxy-D-xylulose-5-phosphate reductoisomerase